MDKIRSGEIKEYLVRFFMGPVYPAVIGVFMLVSHMLHIEYYINFLNVALCIMSFLLCNSVKPFIVVMCTYVFQTSICTLNAEPSSHLYYLGGWRFGVAIFLFALAMLAAVFFLIKNRLITKENLKSLPILLSAGILSVAFLLNGAFSSAWTPSDICFGAIQILCFFIIFYFFVLGLKNERGEELCGYFAYVTAIIALVLVGEVAWLYLTNDALFLDGSVVKEQVQFGWGIWNTAGQQLAMTVPMLFYGVMKNKYPWFYFTVATLATLAAVLTLSRNALIFSVMAYCISAVIACFFGKRKKAFRVLIPIGILAILVIAVVFKDKILDILGDYVSRGLSDNGRFDLWGEALGAFVEAPVLGKGFFGVYPDVPLTGDLFPWMAHNTVVQLLGAMGILGFLAYCYYRFETVRVFVKKPSLEKTMLGISLLTIILGSLLDNFLFYSLPMLYYSVALAIAFHPTLNNNDIKV